MTDVTAETYESEVLKSDKLTLVDFWADWCVPCKMTAPVLDAIDKKLPDVKICKVDVQKNMQLAQKYGIMHIPAIFFYKDGEKVHELIGQQSQSELEAEIQRLL
ncbi:MAG: thioredoxin [Lachnospiraceae bacterium]|nr:thioredoxin [Lachnospiraceae bacterium]